MMRCLRLHAVLRGGQDDTHTTRGARDPAHQSSSFRKEKDGNDGVWVVVVGAEEGEGVQEREAGRCVEGREGDPTRPPIHHLTETSHARNPLLVYVREQQHDKFLVASCLPFLPLFLPSSLSSIPSPPPSFTLSSSTLPTLLPTPQHRPTPSPPQRSPALRLQHPVSTPPLLSLPPSLPPSLCDSLFSSRHDRRLAIRPCPVLTSGSLSSLAFTSRTTTSSPPFPPLIFAHLLTLPPSFPPPSFPPSCSAIKPGKTLGSLSSLAFTSRTATSSSVPLFTMPK